MREKRLSLVVLTCSILVAACASSSNSFVTSNYFSSKYLALVGRTLPVLLSSQIVAVSPATVWIPEDDASTHAEGSVTDEFSEVAHVFARPENRVVRPKVEDEITEQPVPWTSLKNEWKIYQRVQESKRKTPAQKRKPQKQGQSSVETEDTEDNSSEEDEEDEEEDHNRDENNEDEDEEEEDEDEAEDRIDRGTHVPSGVISSRRAGTVKKKKSGSSSPLSLGKKEPIPLAFFGQQNHDDDERDYQKDEASIFRKTQKTVEKKDDDEDDVEISDEAASLEDYADYAQDDDDNDDEDDDSSEKRRKEEKKKLNFDDIPLAIREMILNDLANQNNGSGYHPNLTPQVTGDPQKSAVDKIVDALTKTAASSSTSSSTEQDDDDDGSREENSSEEEDEEEDEANPPPPQHSAEVVPLEPQTFMDESIPTPPAIRPTPKPKKGDDDEDEPQGEDEGGKGGKGDKGGKGKGKGKGKKKKGKGGTGWTGQFHYNSKKPGWGWGHQPQHGWGHKEEKGWGWDPSKHDGVLEQLVRGSTWERVLKYYHWKRDQEQKAEPEHFKDPHAPHNVHKGHHPPHHEEHPGHELSGGDPHWEPGWGWDEQEGKIKKLVKKAFKGSFWERAVRTYAKYKENQAKNPKKPSFLDLDAGDGVAWSSLRR